MQYDLKFEPPTLTLPRLKDLKPEPKSEGREVWCVRCLHRGHRSHACTEAIDQTEKQHAAT